MENFPIVEVIMGIIIAAQNLYLAIKKIWAKNK